MVAGLERIAGIERIRISSIEHTRLPLELVGLMKPPHKLCRFLHMPIQSGSDRILKRMDETTQPVSSPGWSRK